MDLRTRQVESALRDVREAISRAKTANTNSLGKNYDFIDELLRRSLLESSARDALSKCDLRRIFEASAASLRILTDQIADENHPVLSSLIRLHNLSRVE